MDLSIISDESIKIKKLKSDENNIDSKENKLINKKYNDLIEELNLTFNKKEEFII